MSKPELRLFLSCDICGSTKLKQDTSENQDWLKTFIDFYRVLPESLEINLNDAFEGNFKCNVWKFNGDEILFYTDPIDDHTKIEKTIECFIECVKEYRGQLKKKIDSLDLKITAWVAGFPDRNKEFSNDQQKDFIGPEIDTGFRLSKFATPSKMAISIELAFFLARQDSIEIFYDRGECLKGVVQEKEYPVFWIGTYDDAPFDSSLYQSINAKVLGDYCKKYILGVKKSAFLPFIAGDSHFKKEEVQAETEVQEAISSDSEIPKNEAREASNLELIFDTLIKSIHDTRDGNMKKS